VKITPRMAGRLGAVLALAAAAPLAAQAPRGEGPLKHAPRATTGAITPEDARTRLYILADDSMMGRESGTRGNVMGTDYIAREARRMGLEPAGDNGTYFQTIPLVRRGLDPASTLSVDGQALTLWTDYAPLPRVEGVFNFADRMSAPAAAVVFGGRLGDAGMISPELVAGKLVVFAAPVLPNGQPDWRFWTRASLDRYAGAAGVAIATLDASPAGILNFLKAEQMQLATAGAAQGATGPAAVLVTAAVADRLLGAPIGTLQPGAAGKTVNASVSFAEQPVAFPARNVVAVLRGSDPRLRGEYVAIGAHNDHDGVATFKADHESLRVFNRILRPTGAEQPPAAPTPEQAARLRAAIDSLHRARPARVDSIFNGADDDGSGTTAVLEIAEALAAQRVRPRRSILFVWHTAEEKGLLGSEHFSEHPTVPRDSIVAQLNIDMVGRGAPGDLAGGGPNYLQLVGSRRLSTQLGDLVEKVNTDRQHNFKFDYTYDADGHPDNIYCRSDHYNYARWGIPVTFFTTGGHSDYHMLTDEPQYIDYDKLAHVSSLIADVARGVADRADRLVVDKPRPDPHGECKQ
jgi:hypothetical protein